VAQRRLAGPHGAARSTTKSGEGRSFPFTAAIETLLKTQLAEHERLKKANRIVALVFHRNGSRIRYVRKAWMTACVKAGYPGRLLHDMRRSAVRNLERDGVPRSAAMAMVGHKTEAIYRRYAIVDAGLLRDAAARIDRAAGTISGTIDQSAANLPQVNPRKCLILNGAGGEDRTRTPRRERDFKSRASASSATPASLGFYDEPRRVCGPEAGGMRSRGFADGHDVHDARDARQELIESNAIGDWSVNRRLARALRRVPGLLHLSVVGLNSRIGGGIEDPPAIVTTVGDQRRACSG